jgi:hypothetical protein
MQIAINALLNQMRKFLLTLTVPRPSLIQQFT